MDNFPTEFVFAGLFSESLPDLMGNIESGPREMQSFLLVEKI